MKLSLKPSLLSLCAVATLFTACADGVSFKEDSKKSIDSNVIDPPSLPESTAHSDPTHTDGSTPLEHDSDAPASSDPGVSSDNPSTLPPTSKTVLDECLKNWPNHPFTPEEAAKPKIVDINSDVNNNAVLYSDTSETAKPALFLVTFDANVGNQGSLVLKNSKGWYCLHIKAKVINNFRLELGCTSKVAIVSQNARNDNNFEQIRDACP